MASIGQISYLVVIIEIELFLQIYYSSFSMVRKSIHSQIHSQKSWRSRCLCERSMHLDTHKSICRFVCIYIYVMYIVIKQNF